MTGVLPSVGSLEVLDREPGRATCVVKTDPADPVFAGHYPGFPILPGLYLVEFAHRAVLSLVDDELALDAMESCRFLKPVYPGDEVILAITLPSDADRRCKVAASTGNGPVAEIRLRYREGTP